MMDMNELNKDLEKEEGRMELISFIRKTLEMDPKGELSDDCLIERFKKLFGSQGHFVKNDTFSV